MGGLLPAAAQLVNLAFVWTLSAFWTLVVLWRTAIEFSRKGLSLFNRKARPLPPACLNTDEWKHRQVTSHWAAL